MAFPDFFDSAPSVRVHDGLSELLGATTDGIVEYRYADAVRLAGHSCPTVAGAYLMGRAALNALYPDSLPERGEIEVALPEAEDAGVTGVTAQVLTLLTGAAAANGFKGLGGQHARCHLMRFGMLTADDAITFRRRDTDAGVAVSMDMFSIAPRPGQGALLGNILRGQPSAEEKAQFGRLWQDRVRRLIEHADDAEVICVRSA